MSVRVLTACLIGSALLLAPLGSLAKPPDLPNNPKVTCTPQKNENAFQDIVVTVQETETGSFLIGLTPDEPTPERVHVGIGDGQAPGCDETVCPYRAQQVEKKSEGATTEMPGSVLDNLSKLRRAREFCTQGEFYRRCGRAGAALFCFETVKRLCPGSPLAAQADEQMKEIAAAPTKGGAEEAEPKAVESGSCPYLKDRAACEKDRAAAQKAETPGDPISNLEKLEKAEELYRKAMFYQKAGRYEEATACYEEVRRLCPGSRYDGMAATELKQMTAARTTSAPDTAEEQESSRREEAIETQLEKQLSVLYHDAPLRQVLEDLHTLSGLNVVVDTRNLEAEGYHLETPVTLKLRDVRTKSVLNLMLRQVGLTYVIRDEVILVTTRSAAEGNLMTRTYSVADLLMPRKKGSSGEALVKLIRTVAPQTWAERGGRGAVEYYPLGRSIVVNQTADVHEQISEMLAALREYTRQAADEPEEQEPRKPVRAKRKKVTSSKPFIEPPLPRFDSGVLAALQRLLIEMTEPEKGLVIEQQTPAGEEEAEVPERQPEARLLIDHPDCLILRNEEADSVRFARAVEDLRAAVIDRMTSAVCAEVDHTKGPTRGRVNVYLGGLNVRAAWDAEGHGSVTIAVPVAATDAGLMKFVEWMASMGQAVTEAK